MHNTLATPFFYVRDKRSQILQGVELSLETVGGKESLPEGFPEKLGTLYRSVQNRLRWEEELLEYRFASEPEFDIFSLVPEKLKEQDLQRGQPTLLRDCCQLLGLKGEVFLKVPQREVLYSNNSSKEGMETILKEGKSVQNAMRQYTASSRNKIYAVLYCQYLCGQLTIAILHIDKRGKALQLPK